MRRLLLLVILVAQSDCRNSSVRGDRIETDSLRIQNIDLGARSPGSNTFSAEVYNKTAAPLIIGLDIRAVPGLWVRRNWERTYAFAVPAGTGRRIAAPYEFPRLTPEGRLRVTFARVQGVFPAPDRPRDSIGVEIDLQHPAYQKWYDIGKDNPAAIDPRRGMTRLQTAHFDIYAHRGSEASGRLDTIAAERERAVTQISAFLGVDFRDTIRLVFYPDSATKTDETGHIGMGWAANGTIVEIYNPQQRLNPYHEIAHLVAGKLGDPPAFLDEGFATYISEYLGSDALEHLSHYGPGIHTAVCAIMRRHRSIPFQRLFRFTDIGSDSTEPAVAYPQAAAVVQYLVDTQGRDRFQEIYRTLRVTDDSTLQEANEAAFQRLVGVGLARFERDWRASLNCPG
ncbi:MAG: hypothetical protein AB7Q69_11515 [Gemmatimonadales bacterium]